MRILIIEDNEELRDSLRANLEHESFAVDVAPDGDRGLFLALTNDYDVILMDNILPLKNAPEICRQIRADGKTVPIIVLSVKTGPEEKARLLNDGADDYLNKPYSHVELMARIRAVLRRPAKLEPTVFSVGDLTLNSAACEVRRGKRLIHLTRKEFGLLELLLKHKGEVVSRGMILEHVWEVDTDPFSKTIETHVLNLRKKIEKPNAKLIQSVSGRGYKVSTDFIKS